MSIWLKDAVAFENIFGKALEDYQNGTVENRYGKVRENDILTSRNLRLSSQLLKLLQSVNWVSLLFIQCDS